MFARRPSRWSATAWGGIAAALAFQSAPVIAGSIRAFSSPAGYVLRYPAGWTRVQASSGRLLILSRGQRVRGPVIGPGQAAILVRMLASDEAIPPDATRAPRSVRASVSCPTWRMLDTRDSTDPGPAEVNRSFYCIQGARRVLVQLTHWAADPRQASYQRAAAGVASSLRFIAADHRRPPVAPGR
jgi:hypothetical protein